MAERGIEFCAHLARAIADKTKTLTWKPFSKTDIAAHERNESVTSPYGALGDVLWVTEPWGVGLDGGTVYIAEHAEPKFRGERSMPVGYMRRYDPLPRERARLFLRVAKVDVVRLHTVTEDSAKAAGMVPTKNRTHRQEFEFQWQQTYRGLQAWDQNPLCWCIHFELVEQP